MNSEEGLRHAEMALLEHATYGRRTVAAGSFTACLAGGGADALMHVAVPSGPEPAEWGTSVEALVALRREHGFVPRLEFMAEVHPALNAALERRGFVQASADPVMIAELGPATRAAAPPPAGYRRLTADDGALLAAFVKAQAGAFGMPPTTGYAFLDRLRNTLEVGRSIAAALTDGGTPVAGAVVQLGSSGWGELAGVFTVAARRRRGLAAAVCTGLLNDARAEGGTHAWLSAAEDARALYARIGFELVGTQLNYRYAPFSVPPAA